MKRPNLLRLLAWLLCLATLPSAASAVILAVTPNAQGDLHVVDVNSLNSSVAQSANCCAVQTGTVSAQAASDRVYFIANDNGVARLYTFEYGMSGTVASVAISAGYRISHMAYDSLRQRLVALLSADDDTTQLATLDPASGNVTVTGAPGSGCCMLRSGVIAYAASSDLLYAVGRRSTDTSDQLFAFAVTTGTLQAAYPLGTATIAQLLYDSGNLYALSYDATADTLQPARISFSPGFALNTIGTGNSGCCFVLAGSMAFDPANNALVAVTRSSATPASPFVIRSFSLGDGSATIGNPLTANGLFYDRYANLVDRIFADGFE